ncbi:FAD-dependent oxidoreductase [Romboutsia weinsteinii]|uniref:FAD-dependent oxidoreductase n=1 Tax=Romboutsia weinsteinii TaxID=2020949 RepID=A0A371J9B2_9FIRM|nr:FAD-dependent oxidoreductase [Romboutsia weinsteinii]RDY29334.1 FAD-dependent oxidoreductase [Romboutsia weinsteinii]
MENRYENKNESYWILSSQGKSYKSLKENTKANTLVIGAGITGITTAYLLAKQGIDVVLVDADKIAYGSSGRNTGKVTAQHDNMYSKINKKYGMDVARLYYKANESALNLIEEIIKENKIDCHFERLSSYIFTERDDYVKDIQDEYKICSDIGIDCEYHNKLDIPLDIKAALSFKNQGQFNPKKYLDGLIKVVERLGVRIYEDSPIEDLEKGDVCTARTRDGYTIECKKLVIASHLPWYDGLNLYFAKEDQERSYLIGATLNSDLPKGMYINLERPSLTFRTYEGENQKLLIFGGGDHKVGQGGKEGEIYENLKQFAREKFNLSDFKYQWSAQDCMSFDDMPFVGNVNTKQENVYVGTGYSKWGMTNGTMAASLISNLILKKSSIYEDIFKPTRVGVYMTKDFVLENLNVAMNYVSGKLSSGKEETTLEKNQGEIVNIDGKRYGAYKDDKGELYIVDITCTHLGCELKFNGAEKTWDCPCHGSRFDYKGNILEGPALKPLNLYGKGKNDVNPKLI